MPLIQAHCSSSLSCRWWWLLSLMVVAPNHPGGLRGETNHPCCAPLNAVLTNANPTNASSWAWHCIHLPEARKVWEGAGTTRVDRVVAVIDGAVDHTHPALVGKLWIRPGQASNQYGWDFVAGKAIPNASVVPTNQQAHGTRIAGIIGGNLVGSQEGVAPNAKLMLVRWRNSNMNTQPLGGLADAVTFAVNNGAHIINISYAAIATTSEVRQLSNAVRLAEQRGVLVIASSVGRTTQYEDLDGTNKLEYVPCVLPHANVICVTGLLRTGFNKSFLGGYFGTNSVDLAAPSEYVYGPEPAGGFGPNSGTTYSTALVSGAAALVWGLMPKLSAFQVRHLLLGKAFSPPSAAFILEENWGGQAPARPRGVLDLTFVKDAYDHYNRGAAYSGIFPANARNQ